MFPGVNPSQMKALMKQMGIKQEDLDVNRVIIEKKDGNNVIVEPASVQKITMQGQVQWQISGETREESKKEGISEEDIKLVMEKTGKSENEVKRILEETNDIAEAIMQLSE